MKLISRAALPLAFLAALLVASSLSAQDQPESATTNAPSTNSQPAPPPPSQTMIDEATKTFNEVADKALTAMKMRADELHMKGAGLVAYVPGNNTTGWTSKMIVVGHLKTDPTDNDPGSNLLAIAYSKASEMADTLKPSGEGARPPLKGEFGWQGGWIVKCNTGYLIAAFSGGKSEDDVKVSKTALEIFSGLL